MHNFIRSTQKVLGQNVPVSDLVSPQMLWEGLGAFCRITKAWPRLLIAFSFFEMLFLWLSNLYANEYGKRSIRLKEKEGRKISLLP